MIKETNRIYRNKNPTGKMEAIDEGYMHVFSTCKVIVMALKL